MHIHTGLSGLGTHIFREEAPPPFFSTRTQPPCPPELSLVAFGLEGGHVHLHMRAPQFGMGAVPGVIQRAIPPKGQKSPVLPFRPGSGHSVKSRLATATADPFKSFLTLLF
uniref:Uncharacterized protein n=1 Tax=Sphaerodactylus townsendi TaxID=933632 RepID=A0ACB8FSS1_9SAUR